VDRTFNGHKDWFELRQELVHKRRYSTTNREQGLEEAYAASAELVGKLGDPYTRFLRPSKFNTIVNAATSSVGGVGVEIVEDVDVSCPAFQRFSFSFSALLLRRGGGGGGGFLLFFFFY
jgi:C-terminal processing protease CtpA/Prc